jgi:hypothetical protein
MDILYKSRSFYKYFLGPSQTHLQRFLNKKIEGNAHGQISASLEYNVDDC